MIRLLLALRLLGMGFALFTVLHAEDRAPDFNPAGCAFIEKYCIGCHGLKEPEADLSLEPFHDSLALIKQRKVWESVQKMLVGGEMPPPKKKKVPHPSPAESEAFIALVKSIFEYSDKNAKPDPGRVTMRRLNRGEYRNTIRDLIGVNFDPTEDFPSDDIGHGFDNIGDVLTLPPVLMERYLTAADNIMSQAILPAPPPVPKRRLASQYTEPASSEGASLMENGFRRMVTDGKRHIDIGPINTPYQWDPNGEYTFRTRVFGDSGVAGKPIKVTILVMGQDLPEPSPAADLERLCGNVLKPARILKTFEVKADKRESAEILEVRIPPMPNRQRMMIAIDKPEAGQPPAKLYVEYLALDGPLDTRPVSQMQLLKTSATAQSEKTREVLTRFLRRAFRRTPAPEEIEHSIKVAEAAQASGDAWESAIQLAMQAVLCSPKFLFRVEEDADPNNPGVRPLDDFQVASRLSYFIWGSMPDDTLLDLAEKKELTPNLEAQVKRMLADPRASYFIQNFARQWLQIGRIEFISPDGQLFPSFNVNLRKAMLRETELFVESILRDDRSVLDLISADYTFLNEPLAQHYGILDTKGNRPGQKPVVPGGKPIKGEAFQRVSLQDHLRGGLITQASILTVTSNPTRTSPVKRGKWVLEQILGAPPPPPPPNVPELPSEAKDVAASSLRQRLEIHRQNPACANCHAKMDPIGFALENFNAVGAYRTKDGTFEIDPSGEFADGMKVSGPLDLKKIIMDRKDVFARCLSEKMLIYAAGRGLEYYDRPTVDRILKGLAAGEYKFSALVTQIVLSDAFTKRAAVKK